MFDSIVVVSDLTDRDPALPVAGTLARRADVPVEIVGVAPPGTPEGRDALDFGPVLAKLPGVRAMPVVLHSNAPYSTVREFLSDRPDALVVMSTHARGPVTETLFGSFSEALLVQLVRPMLLVGPLVGVHPPPQMTTLLACVDSRDDPESMMSAVVAWDRTFGGDAPWFIEVVPADTELDDRLQRGDASEVTYVHHLAGRAHDLGVEAQWELTHGTDSEDAVLEFAHQFDAPVFALTSRRWTDPMHVHFHSTAREIARRATVPVLVVHPASQPEVPVDDGPYAAFEPGHVAS